MWFNRDEFDFYARFHSWGSARETFDWEELCNLEITIPSLSIQNSIISIQKIIDQKINLLDTLKQNIEPLVSIIIKNVMHKN